MPSFPQSGVEFVADAEQYLETVDEMLSATEELADGVSQIADDISSGFDDIEPPELDFDFEAPDMAFDDVPEEIETDLNINETEQAGQVLGLLRMIAAAEIFTLILDIAGTAVEFFNAIQSFTVAPILDVQDAIARFGAQTGASAEEMVGMADVINNLHFNEDVGDGFDDIVATLIEVRRSGVSGFGDMEEAALGALQIAKSQGTDAVETFRAMNVLVSQGMVDGWTEAANVMTAGIQTGNNRAGDLLQTLVTFGPRLAEMGFTAEQAMGLFNSGLDAGFRSTQDITRAIDTMNNNVVSAAGDLESPVAQALDSIGVELPAVGEQVGVDFFQSVIEGLNKNPEAADAAIAEIFGTRGGKFSEAFIDLTLVDQQFTELENRAADAATNIDDSLRGALEDFILWIQGEISKFLSSSEIDLPGKLTELKERVQALIQNLAEGEGLPVALEAALEAPGLAADIRRLEGAIGNFIIDFALGISNILEGIRQFEAAENVRGAIGPRIETQLTFDVQTAETTEEIRNAVVTAFDRGLEMVDVTSALEDAMQEAMANGDFAGAMDIGEFIDGMLFGTPLADELGSFADTVTQELNLQLFEALRDQNFEEALNLAEMLGDEEVITGVQRMAAEAGTAYDDLGQSATDASDTVRDATFGHSIVPDIKATLTAGQASLPPLAGLFRMIESVASITLPATSSYVDALVMSIIEGMGNAMPVIDGMIQKLHDLASVATSTRETVQSAVNAANSAGGGGGGNTTNVNVNQTNNVQSNAQAASISQSTSRGVRGMAA